MSVAQVEAVVVGASDRLFICNLSEDRNAGCGERCGEWADTAVEVLGRVEIDGFVLMETARLNPLHLKDGLRVERVRNTGVDLRGRGVAVLGVEEAACGARSQVVNGRRIDWKRINSQAIVGQEDVGSRNDAAAGCGALWIIRAGADDVERGCEDGVVRLLRDEEGDIFEGVAEVEPVAAAKNEATVAGDVVGEADPRADVVVVIAGEAGVVAADIPKTWKIA